MYIHGAVLGNLFLTRRYSSLFTPGSRMVQCLPWLKSATFAALNTMGRSRDLVSKHKTGTGRINIIANRAIVAGHGGAGGKSFGIGRGGLHSKSNASENLLSHCRMVLVRCKWDTSVLEERRNMQGKGVAIGSDTEPSKKQQRCESTGIDFRCHVAGLQRPIE